MRTTSFAVATALLAHEAAAYFILQGPTLAIDRQDAIISPGVNVVASHVHNLVGASNINSNSNFASLQNSKCTSLPVTVDKSAYWQPNLYYYDPLGQTYQSIPSYSKIYYLQRPGPKNEKIVAFPEGFRMVAGNPNRKSYNPSSFADQAISYVCQDYSGGHQGDPDWADRGNFFTHNCPQGMRAEVVFPSCWNGQDLYKSDNSHVAYPVQAVNTGDCPSTHPVHLVTLFQEFVYDVAQFPYNGNDNGTVTWVLANGDTTGYGLHADFLMGWDRQVLQDALDQCTGQVGGVLENCPPLAPYIDTNAANGCKIEGNLVDEDVGIGHPIKQLPGCNLPWPSGPKPSCSGTQQPATPGFKSSKSTPAAGYSYYGCLAEPSGARLFTGASTTSNNMTSAVCTAFCGQRGFEWSGIEYSSECYCGSTMSNGGSNATIPESRCSNTCSGNTNEVCGGASTLSVYRNPSLAIGDAPALPAGWSKVGCIVDGTSAGRTLSSYSYSSTSMTITSCVNTCIGRGFSYAGIEYSSECYCSNAPRTLQASQKCNMMCSGDPRYTCGGPNALTMFSAAPAPASSSSIASSSSSSLPSSVSTASSLSSSGSAGSSVAVVSASSVKSSSGSSFASSAFSSTSVASTSNISATSSTAVTSSTAATISPASSPSSRASTASGVSTVSASTVASSSSIGTASTTNAAALKASSTSPIASSSAPTSISAPASSAVTSTSSSTAAPAAATSPSGYQYVGCTNDGTKGRLLTGASLVANDMTVEKCAAFCGQTKYLYSGLSYGKECYCGSTFNNGGTGALIAQTKCSMSCAGNKAQKCGAGNILSLYRNPNYTPAPVVLPANWNALGCLVDNFNKFKTLKGYTFNNSKMTQSLCINRCQSLGYSYAGIEYSSECYCANALSYNATSSACSMPCSGARADGTSCGGPDALTAFKYTGALASKRALESRPLLAFDRRDVMRGIGSLI